MFAFSSASLRNPIVFKMVLTKFKTEVVIEYLLSILQITVAYTLFNSKYGSYYTFIKSRAILKF